MQTACLALPFSGREVLAVSIYCFVNLDPHCHVVIVRAELAAIVLSMIEVNTKTL
jgi:hypothetical protein